MERIGYFMGQSKVSVTIPFKIPNSYGYWKIFDKQKLHIMTSDGICYSGILDMKYYRHIDADRCTGMIQTKVTLAYVEDLNMKVQIKDHQNKSLQISDKELVKGCSVESYIHKEHPFVIFGDCQLFLNFQPKKEKILTQRLLHNLYSQKPSVSGIPEDVTIICENTQIKMHKCILSKISPVFHSMLVENRPSTNTNTGNNSVNPEILDKIVVPVKNADQNNSSIIVKSNNIIPANNISNNNIRVFNVAPMTVASFKKIIYEDFIDPDDLTVDLLMFSHKYKIRALYEICSEELGFNLTRENVLKVVHAAFLAEDDGLFLQGIDFIRKMLRSHSVNDIQEWIYYHVKHPECAARIYEAIQFHSLQETPFQI